VRTVSLERLLRGKIGQSLALARAGEMDRRRLTRTVKEYGSARAERLLASVLQPAKLLRLLQFPYDSKDLSDLLVAAARWTFRETPCERGEPSVSLHPVCISHVH